MTQEQKELLLKDLCSRLPYGVKGTNVYGKIVDLNHQTDYSPYMSIKNAVLKHDYKPYLFPMSSMTEEQRKEYDSIIYHNVELHADRYYEVIDVDSFELLHDFYHKNHFDYRGLIPLGLAIDCTNLNIY